MVEETIQVVDAEPPNIFDHSSIRAVVGSNFSHELLTDRELKSLAFNICLDISSRIKRYED